MIAQAKEQGAKNYEALYALQDGLEALINELKTEGAVSFDLYNKWSNKVMGWVSRYFEGHPILDKLVDIDNAINVKR
ncbi:hypothetical protein KXQ82_12080 [Mucilaginibacter sp. HMF5004]|uniref:hypothetical protein n=1 Tax=Mucilaginibacter rivuli TaxID=2857527 RepID=UPI001C5F31CC|nr:hypothetical protein [Mucilaginibacter rivuli]MBW4890464.1 hypothetical protein [Mucilaginibacter rivuli]